VMWTMARAMDGYVAAAVALCPAVVAPMGRIWATRRRTNEFAGRGDARYERLLNSRTHRNKKW